MSWTKQCSDIAKNRVNGRYNGWKKRASWYPLEGGRIKIVFEDEAGKRDQTYPDAETAQKVWDEYKANF